MTAAIRTLTAVMVLMLTQLGAGAVAVTAQALPASPVPAAPVPSDEPVSTADVTLGWPTLGLSPNLLISTSIVATTATVPVPTGMKATRLRGVIHTPVNIGAGYLEIDDGDGKFLAAVDLPPMSSAQVVRPFDVDISAVGQRAASIGLSFTVRPLENSGQVCGPVQQLALSELATVFTGSEPPPTTVANIFAPVLERVAIYAPVDADEGEQQAVLTLVSTMARLYEPLPLEITAINLPRDASPPPAGPLARAIVVERGTAGVDVENPGSPGAYLRISGRGDELTAQVSLLDNQLQSLVQVPAARVDQAGSRPPVTGDTLTFGQLQMVGSSDVLRVSNFTVGVDRAALGSGRIDNVQVHLLANYTPVSKDDTATVTVRSNGVVLYAAPLDGTGLVDATFDLKDQALTQRINLDFALTFTPHQECGPWVAPMSFRVDPRSTLTMHAGGPALGGFSAVPSEFAPEFLVAFDGSSPNQLSYAARAVAEIARLTATPITPRVVDLKAAADANTGALIVANAVAVKQTSLDPPLAGEGSAINVHLPSELRAVIPSGIGSIQAFADPARNRTVVLITTTGAWSLVDPLVGYLGGIQGGWSALTGDVLAAGPAGTPTDLSIRSDAGGFEPPPSSSSALWVGIGIGAAVIVLAALAAAWLWRRRHTPL